MVRPDFHSAAHFCQNLSSGRSENEVNSKEVSRRQKFIWIRGLALLIMVNIYNSVILAYTYFMKMHVFNEEASMINFTKVTAIYTIVYAIVSFILLISFGVFTIASRGAIILTPFIGLPFFIGFMHIVGFVCEIICFRINKDYPAKKRLVLISLIVYMIEILALALPMIGIFGKMNSYLVQNIVLFAIGSIPVTKVCLLVLSIIILVKFRKRKETRSFE